MAANKGAPRYPASELIRAGTGVERDVLTVVLNPAQTYTKAEARKLCEGFLKGGNPDVSRKLDVAE